MERENNTRETRMTGLLLLATAAGCLFIFHNYLFGDKLLVFSDVGSDTKQQYIMWYNEVANRLRQGDLSLWDFFNGLGATSYNLNLFAPFLWIIYGIGALLGPEHIAGAMVCLLILEILLAGQFCYLMLSTHPYCQEAKLLSSFMYAFNGYLMIWGQHYAMGGVVVLLPLLLYFVERSLTRRRALFGVALMTGLILLNGYYQGYMVLLGIGGYVTVRTLIYEVRPWKEKIRDFLSLALSMAFGILVGAINLFPSLRAVQESARLSAKTPLLDRIRENLCLWDKEYYRTLLYRLFGNNLQGAGNEFVGTQNYYEAISLCFSVLFIFLLFQYVFTLFRRSCALRQKVSCSLCLLTALFMVGVKAGSLPFNAFAYAFSRHSFLLMPFFAILCGGTLTRLFEEGLFSRAGLILAALLCALIYGKAYQNYGLAVYETNALILLAGSLATALILALFSLGRLGKKTAFLLLASVLFITILSDCSLCVRYRQTVQKTDTGYFQDTYSSDTQKALAWIRETDDGFYRVEKDYSSAAYYLEAMAQGYYGVSTYNSMQTGGLIQFVKQLWPGLLTGYDSNHHLLRNAIYDQPMVSLVGVKYLLTHTPDLEKGGYRLVHQEGSVYIYRNDQTENIAKFYEKTISRKMYQKNAEKLSTGRLLSQVLITEEKTDSQIAQEELKSWQKEEIADGVDRESIPAEGSSEGGISLAVRGEVTIPLIKEALSAYPEVTVSFAVESEAPVLLTISAGDQRCMEYFSQKKSRLEMTIPAGADQITIASQESDTVYRVKELRLYGSQGADFSQDARISVDRPAGDVVSGHLEADRDGIVMLAIPYQSGWKVTVDGKEAEVTVGDYLFIAFRVTQGVHTFQAVYEAPAFRISAMTTVIALLLLFIGRVAYGRWAETETDKCGRKALPKS